MLDSALGRLSLSTTSCRRRSVAELPPSAMLDSALGGMGRWACLLGVFAQSLAQQLSQLVFESLADSGECGEKAPIAALRSFPSESASLSSSSSGGTSRCPSAMLDSALGRLSLSSTSGYEAFINKLHLHTVLVCFALPVILNPFPADLHLDKLR
jgi:hypothetical protein